MKCTDIGAPEASGCDASHDPDVGLPPLPHKRFSSRLLPSPELAGMKPISQRIASPAPDSITSGLRPYGDVANSV